MPDDAQALDQAGQAATTGNPSEPIDGNVSGCPQPRSWVELSLVQGNEAEPMGEEPFELVDASGQAHKGRLDRQGHARVEHLPAGPCEVTFPGVSPPEEDEASDAPFSPPSGTKRYDPEAAPYTCDTETEHAFSVPPWTLVELLPVEDEDDEPVVDEDAQDEGQWELVELSDVTEDEDED